MHGGLMEHLGPAAIDWRKQMHRRRFQRNEVIFHQGELGDTVHFIEKGCVLVEVFLGRGDKAALSVRRPGEIIGELAVIGDGRRSARVTAREPTETLALNQKTLAQLRAEHPTVDRYFLEALADKLSQSTDHLVDVLFASASTRVMRVLLRLVASIDRGVHPPVVNMRQSDIAAMAGTSRQFANSTLKRTESNGVIRIGRGRIQILDLARLEVLAR